MDRSGSGILIPFFKSASISRITCLFFAIAFASRCSIFTALRCAFAFVCTSLVCYIFNCTYVDSCSSFITMFSSLVSFCIIYASTKCYSSTSFSFNFSMHTWSIDVAPGFVCSFALQHHLLHPKNSTTNILVISMSWIIVCANCIFSLYTFPSTHSKDDDECGGNLIANNWIFNTPSLYVWIAFLLLFFSIILLPPPTFVCVHSFALPFLLLFVIILQLHSLHLHCYELQNFENAHNF